MIRDVRPQVVITYDVPWVEAAGLNPIVPVVVMDEREPDNVIPAEIKTGERRIISYLLSPLRKYRQESLRER